VSLLFRTANIEGPYWGEFPGASASDVIPHRLGMQLAPGHMINNESALRHSAVWACLRLRANLVSTFPIDVYRKAQWGVPHFKVATPPVIIAPGGTQCDYMEWMYSTQFDLDRAGNSIGVITQRNGYGLPAEIQLVPLAWVSVNVIDNVLTEYFIRGRSYRPDQIWHEKQYTVAGFHLGLSPIMYAAWCIGEHLSIQDFAISWFTQGGIPRAHLKNEMLPTPTTEQTDTIKARVKESVHTGDVLVTGKDWTYSMIQAEQTGMEWLQARNIGHAEIARFLDCPADLIDAAISGSSVTYANVVQRNLQLLIMSLGPAVVRRENALNKLLPNRQFCKIDTDALLRMDPATRARVTAEKISSRVLAPSEARLLDDRPPYTESQLAEFDRFWPTRAAPAQAGEPKVPTTPYTHPPELAPSKNGSEAPT
jgi:HK97 family phage portal protein